MTRMAVKRDGFRHIFSEENEPNPASGLDPAPVLLDRRVAVAVEFQLTRILVN